MAEISVRQSQIAHTYATGSIGDFPGLSLMFITHDHEQYDWGKPDDPLNDNTSIVKRRIITDKRLSDAFGIKNFVLPPIEGFGRLSLNTVRFPLSMYCPGCGRIYFANHLEKWKNGFVQNALRTNGISTYDDALRAYHCVDCQTVPENSTKKARFIELVPTRFIIANEEGFIDDFPWDWYVHRNPKIRNERGKGHNLYLEFDSSSTSLESISIISKNKEGKFIARESLGSIFNQETTFINQGDEYLPYVKNKMPKPWLGRNENGFVLGIIDDVPTPEQIQRDKEGKIINENLNILKRKYPRTLQRGANNLFFPLVFKGIRLPEGLNNISQALINHIINLKTKFSENQPDTFREYSNNDWQDKILSLHGLFPCSKNELQTILGQLFPLNEENTLVLDKKQKLRLEEYKCYLNENITESKEIWYKARHIEVSNEYLKNEVKIDRISLLDKINELKIYRGFTRIRPLANEDLIFETDSEQLAGRRLDEYNRICDARKDPLNTNELPCAEVKGEGIFLKFNNKALKDWENNESVKKRFDKMKTNLNNYFTAFSIEDGSLNISARYIFLHTLSHIIMQQLANDSGYSLSSLTEIIYCNKPNEEDQMNGILIYTSSSDTEGTLGGLVEKGEPKRLASIISKAVDKAKWCSSDPLCITSPGQGFMTTNMAACYSCVMVPETCCENINKFLDRKLVLNFFGLETL